MALVPFPSKAGKPAASDPDPDWDDDDSSPDGGGKMSFLEHLDELRKRIVWALVGVVIGFPIAIVFLNPLWLLRDGADAAAARARPAADLHGPHRGS